MDELVMIPVESSNIAEIGYLDEVIYIRFKNGGLYSYSNVTQALYDDLLNSESKGRFVATCIKGIYPCKKEDA